MTAGPLQVVGQRSERQFDVACPKQRKLLLPHLHATIYWSCQQYRTKWQETGLTDFGCRSEVESRHPCCGRFKKRESKFLPSIATTCRWRRRISRQRSSTTVTINVITKSRCWTLPLFFPPTHSLCCPVANVVPTRSQSLASAFLCRQQKVLLDTRLDRLVAKSVNFYMLSSAIVLRKTRSDRGAGFDVDLRRMHGRMSNAFIMNYLCVLLTTISAISCWFLMNLKAVQVVR